MKAIVHEKYGPPEILQVKEIEKPSFGHDEILVKVKATTVNRTDCAILRAKPFIMRFVCGLLKPKNTSPGTDFAGIVESVGQNVKKFKVGDKVFGFNDEGLQSQAEYLAIKQDKPISIIPDNMGFDEAAASLEGFHYAYNTINKVKLKPEHKVLLNGASGAIGSALLQILKADNIYVTAVCGSEGVEKIQSYGADKVINYEKEDFTKDKEKYDFVFDTVGKSSFSACKPIMKEQAVYISSELGWMAQNIFYALFTPIFSKKTVKFPIPSKINESIDQIQKLVGSGKYKPMIDRKYPYNEVVDAYSYVESGKKLGNVVLNFNS